MWYSVANILLNECHEDGELVAVYELKGEDLIDQRIFILRVRTVILHIVEEDGDVAAVDKVQNLIMYRKQREGVMEQRSDREGVEYLDQNPIDYSENGRCVVVS